MRKVIAYLLHTEISLPEEKGQAFIFLLSWFEERIWKIIIASVIDVCLSEYLLSLKVMNIDITLLTYY